MNSHLNRLRTLVLPFILGMFLSGCTTSPQPQNTNTRAQSNANGGANNIATLAGNNPPVGFVDEVKGEFKTGASITVLGWAADAEDGAPVKKVEVLIDSNVVAEASLGVDRPDVVKVTNRSDWQRAGWEVSVRLANVAPGLHKLTAVAYDSAGTKAALNGARNIEVVR